jgi:hypothetical protein
MPCFLPANLFNLLVEATHTSNIETHPNPWNLTALFFEKPTSQVWMILFHQKLDAKISLRLFGLLNLNSFIILNQALPTLFHKVDPMALLWPSYGQLANTIPS